MRRSTFLAGCCQAGSMQSLTLSFLRAGRSALTARAGLRLQRLNALPTFGRPYAQWNAPIALTDARLLHPGRTGPPPNGVCLLREPKRGGVFPRHGPEPAVFARLQTHHQRLFDKVARAGTGEPKRVPFCYKLLYSTFSKPTSLNKVSQKRKGFFGCAA